MFGKGPGKFEYLKPAKMEIKRIDAANFASHPGRYILVEGTAPGAPLCSTGNRFQFVGFDIETKEYVRFTKSVFMKLKKEIENKYPSKRYL